MDHWLARSQRPSNCQCPGGFALIETLVGVAILAGTLVVLNQSILGTVRSSAIQTETMQAWQVAEAMVETMKAQPFEQLVDLYTANPGFAVDGLAPQDGDADGLVGEILLPLTAGTPLVLREDVQDAAFRLPMDLNGDGLLDAADHSADYVVLPVIVRLRWTGPSGDRDITLTTILMDP